MVPTSIRMAISTSANGKVTNAMVLVHTLKQTVKDKLESGKMEIKLEKSSLL
jgi:hypothetical protein